MDAPAMQTASGRIYRATCMLALAYWRGGCSALPDDEVSLAALARLPVPQLRGDKPAIIAALAQITPALDAEHARCASLQAGRAEQTRLMRERKVARRAASALHDAIDLGADAAHSPQRGESALPVVAGVRQRKPHDSHSRARDTAFAD
jgi:hypothetical protein